jgi:hypothetical protein
MISLREVFGIVNNLSNIKASPSTTIKTLLMDVWRNNKNEDGNAESTNIRDFIGLKQQQRQQHNPATMNNLLTTQNDRIDFLLSPSSPTFFANGYIFSKPIRTLYTKRNRRTSSNC